MANYIVSYDLNGPGPSHEEMDEHVKRIAGHFGRVLETVWYVGCFGQTDLSLRDYLASILGSEDRLLVVECRGAAWRNLLVNSQSLATAWSRYE